MACCPKEYVEKCAILVCVDAPAPHNLDLYSRLRFGLLASSWLPIPLGMFLWSVLHVTLLIVNGPAIWVLGLLGAFIFYAVFVFTLATIFYIGYFLFFALITVAYDLILRSTRFCWSLVDFLACKCHEPIFDCRGGFCVTFELELWELFKALMWKLVFEDISIGVPCMSGSLYQEKKDRMLETWSRWWEEVVHKHDAIAV